MENKAINLFINSAKWIGSVLLMGLGLLVWLGLSSGWEFIKASIWKCVWFN